MITVEEIEKLNSSRAHSLDKWIYTKKKDGDNLYPTTEVRITKEGYELVCKLSNYLKIKKPMPIEGCWPFLVCDLINKAKEKARLSPNP